MNLQAQGFGYSVMVHIFVVLTILQAGTMLTQQQNLLVIDFSIIDQEAQSPIKNQRPVTAQKQPAPKRPAKPAITQKPAPKKFVPKKEIVKPSIQRKVAALPSGPEPAVLYDTATIQIKEVPPPHPVEPPKEIAERTKVPEPEVQDELMEEPVMTTLSEKKTVWNFPAPAAGGNMKLGKRQNETAIARYTKANFNNIRAGVQRLMSYPRLARRMGWEGKVVVSFIVYDDGTVSNIQIVKSSGVPALDKNAVATIKKAAPFPKPPIPARLIVPMVYRLG